MSTKHADLFKALAAEIPPDQVKYRQQRGQRIAYITSRVVKNRLDKVAGPENWKAVRKVVETITRDKTVIVIADCKLAIRVGEEWIVKEETGGASNPDPIVARKGAYSDALKRAGVEFGIGRELYGDGVADFEADELASLEGPAAPPPRAEEPARPRPSERKAEEKKKAPPVADTKLASKVTTEQYKEFQAWREGFLAEEKDRLQEVGADPETGELPPGWKVECNQFRLVQHFIGWLRDRGTLDNVGSDGAIKAKCVAWVWSNKRADFDAELDRWRKKLEGEAIAWRKAPSTPPASLLPAPRSEGPSPFDEGRANALGPAERAQDGEVDNMRDFLANLAREVGGDPAAELHRRMVAAELIPTHEVSTRERLNQIALAKVFWPAWLAFQIEALAAAKGGASDAA